MRTKKQVCLSMSAECHARLAELAQRRGLTNSALVEQLVNDQVAHDQPNT